MVKDLVEVVRCKDCKYMEFDSKEDDAIVCRRTNDGWWRSSNDYCSFGCKRMTHGIDQLKHLTEIELRDIIGKPIYIVPVGDNPDWYPQWIILREDYQIVNSINKDSRVYLLRMDNYAKTWIAYGKEVK